MDHHISLLLHSTPLFLILLSICFLAPTMLLSSVPIAVCLHLCMFDFEFQTAESQPFSIAPYLPKGNLSKFDFLRAKTHTHNILLKAQGSTDKENIVRD